MKTALQLPDVPATERLRLTPKLSSVLVPTDFSPLAQTAVDAAVSLIQGWPGVTITLLHVVEPLHLIGTAECGLPPDIGVPWHVNQADTDMKRLCASYAPRAALQTRVLVGNPARMICELAQKEHFDLIFLSSHGLTGLSRVFIGSVAERVAQDALCPVLVVKPCKVAAGKFVPAPLDLKVQQLVVGYDHRHGAARALAMARQIAAQTGAPITLVHALEPSPTHVAVDSLNDPETETEWVKAALVKLGGVRNSHLPESERWQIEAHLGHPWEVLVAAAKGCNGNLVVVGPHEHTRWGHSFMGSTAQRVVRLAPCPVLAVK